MSVFSKLIIFIIAILALNKIVFYKVASNYQSYKHEYNKTYSVTSHLGNKLIITSADNQNYIFYCNKKCREYTKNDLLKFNSLILPLNKALTPKDYNIVYNYPNVVGRVSARSKIKIVKSKPSIFNDLKNHIISKIRSSSKNPISLSLLTGNKKELPKELYKKFQDTGTAHVLSISGLHIGGIAFIFFLLFRKIFSLFRTFSEKYDNKKLALIFALSAAFFFLFIAGFPISGQRAFIFVLCFSLAHFFNVKYSLENILFISASILLLMNPYNLFLVGFQLSFSALAAILICLKYFDKDEYGYLRKTLLISFCITVLTLPLTKFYFNSGNLLSPLANMWVIPYISLIVMPFGMLAILSSFVGLEGFIFIIFDFLLDILEQGISLFEMFYFYPVKNLEIAYSSLFILFLVQISLLCLKKSRAIILVSSIFYLAIFFIPRNHPDIIIFNRANFFILNQGGKFLTSKNLEKKSYLKDRVEGYYGPMEILDTETFQNSLIKCENSVCFYKKDKQRITLIYKKIDFETLQEICSKSDLVIYARKTFNSCYKIPTITKYGIGNMQNIHISVKNGKLEIK